MYSGDDIERTTWICSRACHSTASNWPLCIAFYAAFVTSGASFEKNHVYRRRGSGRGVFPSSDSASRGLSYRTPSVTDGQEIQVSRCPCYCTSRGSTNIGFKLLSSSEPRPFRISTANRTSRAPFPEAGERDERFADLLREYNHMNPAIHDGLHVRILPLTIGPGARG
jgi:hypothetical protein